MEPDMLKRPINVGFSGGEKKRNEILQMSVMEPRMCILDETDSGLDVDAMKLVAEGVNALRDANRSFLVITHYQRLLDHIVPDVVHIMAEGRIIKTGGPDLALEVERTAMPTSRRRWRDGGAADADEAGCDRGAAGRGRPGPRAGPGSARRATRRWRLREMGLPHRRDEYWKFTEPDTLVQPEVAPEAALFEHDEPPMFDGFDRLRIVFVDGVFDPGPATILSLEGVTIERLSDAARRPTSTGPGTSTACWRTRADPVERPLAALNTGAGRGRRADPCHRPAATRPVSLIYRHASTTSDAMPAPCRAARRGRGADGSGNGPAAARFNKVMEVEVADGARVPSHPCPGARPRAPGRDAHLSPGWGESVFKSFTLTANGVLTRNECVIELTGDDAVAHVAGAAWATGISTMTTRCSSPMTPSAAKAGRCSRRCCERRDGCLPGQDPGEARGRRRPTATRSASRSCWTATASSSPSRSWRSTPTTWPALTARPRGHRRGGAVLPARPWRAT